jgi:hypothetical protein
LLELGCHVYSFNLMTFVVAINFFANMFCLFGQLLFSQLNDRRVSVGLSERSENFMNFRCETVRADGGRSSLTKFLIKAFYCGFHKAL